MTYENINGKYYKEVLQVDITTEYDNLKNELNTKQKEFDEYIANEQILRLSKQEEINKLLTQIAEIEKDVPDVKPVKPLPITEIIA